MEFFKKKVKPKGSLPQGWDSEKLPEKINEDNKVIKIDPSIHPSTKSYRQKVDAVLTYSRDKATKEMLNLG